MPTPTTAACNPWLGRKMNRDMLDKLHDLFMDAWADDETYGYVAGKLDEDLMDFFFACTIDQVDSDEDTITVRFKVPAPETLDV